MREVLVMSLAGIFGSICGGIFSIGIIILVLYMIFCFGDGWLW